MLSAARLPLLLVLAVAALVSGLWVWLGQPVRMPATSHGPEQKLPCLSYAPFREDQSPFIKGLVISEAQIDEDLAQLAKITSCVRTYSIEMGLDKVPQIARKHGLEVLQGIWLGALKDRNREEVEIATALARENPDVVKGVIVGNEVLLRGEMSPADLAATIRDVKSKVGDVPVTYADVWEFWERNKALTQEVDFVTIHILPYWEDMPVSAAEAGAHIDSIRQKMAEEFPGKEILIGETGWPSSGRMREGALPSPSNQARVVQDVLTLAEKRGYRVNLIEAFDQPWKRRSEGTVGGHWGIIDSSNREAKFAWGQPVEDFPGWRMHIAVGLAAVVAAFGAAALAGRGREGGMRTGEWLAVALIALASGATLGAALSALPLESLGLVGWVRNGAFFALAVLSAVVLPAVIARGQGLAPMATALFDDLRAVSRPAAVVAALMLALGIAAVGLATLELVFSPRYKDFPIYSLTGVVVALLATALAHRAPHEGAGLAEQVGMWGFLLAGLYIPLNETLANWQALWFGVLCLLLSFTLWRVRAARTRG